MKLAINTKNLNCSSLEIKDTLNAGDYIAIGMDLLPEQPRMLGIL